jgi:hypothetical protein
VLDEELACSPEKYRAPLLLCYLVGLTRDEAKGLKIDRYWRLVEGDKDAHAPRGMQAK